MQLVASAMEGALRPEPRKARRLACKPEPPEKYGCDSNGNFVLEHEGESMDFDIPTNTDLKGKRKNTPEFTSAMLNSPAKRHFPQKNKRILPKIKEVVARVNEFFEQDLT